MALSKTLRDRFAPDKPAGEVFGESPQQVGQVAVCLRGDDGMEILPRARAYYFPAAGPVTEADLLATWLLSIEPSGDPAVDRAALTSLEAQETPRVREAIAACNAVRNTRGVYGREAKRPACPPGVRARLERGVDAALVTRGGVLRPLLEKGLRDRLGIQLDMPGSNWHRTVFTWLIENGAKMPAHLAVCEKCSLVFEPRRKSYAFKCEACHRSPSRVTPFTNSKNAKGGETFAGPPGMGVLRTHCCEACGELFETKRSDKRCCSGACSRRIRRAAGQ